MRSSKRLALTAMLIALAVVFQNLRLLPFLNVGSPVSTFVIGTLVNLVLYISVLVVGLGGAIVISVLTPFIALMQGQIALPVLLPIVMMGNILLVFMFHLFYKQNKYASVVIASVFKWLLLWFMTSYGLSILFQINLPEKAIASFNIPQIITALLGGLLAITVSRYIKRYIK